MPSIKQRYRKARKRYIRNPSNENLRWFLILKGKRGRWDKRMHDYTGVASNVTPAVKKFIARGYGAGLVPTSTTGGQHADGSYHGQNRAADLGLRGPEIGTAKGIRKMTRFQRREFKRRNSLYMELIGPDNNATILRSWTSPLAEGNTLENAHDDHVHGAI